MAYNCALFVPHRGQHDRRQGDAMACCLASCRHAFNLFCIINGLAAALVANLKAGTPHPPPDRPPSTSAV